MTVRYYLTITDSDLSGGTNFDKVLSLNTQAANTLSIAISAGTTTESYGYTISLISEGITGTSTGTFTINLNVTTGISSTFGSISLSRLNSTGTVQATSSATAEQELTAGIKAFTLTNPALGTWNTTDRLRVNYIFRNGLKKAATVVIGTGTIDESVLTPFSFIYNKFTGYFWD